MAAAPHHQIRRGSVFFFFSLLLLLLIFDLFVWGVGMLIDRVFCAYFSPTGGTKRVAMALQRGFIEGIEGLTPSVLTYNFLTPERRAQKVPQFTANDLVIFTYPVFFGRMPWAYQEWPELKGNGAQAVVVSVYGNRAIEDAERETMAFLSNHGFKILGRIEAIAEHSQERTLAQGRPNQEDKDELKLMAKKILQRIKQAHDEHPEQPLTESLPELPFDRTTPLKAKGKAPAVPAPLSEEACEHCDHCAHMCPCGIIDEKTNKVAPEDYDKCMGCRACMHVCHDGYRGFSDEVNAAIAQRMAMVKAANSEPKPNVLQLA